MHVLGRVLEHAVASVVVLDVVQGHGPEAAPAQGHDEGVPVLQDAVVPPVFLQPQLNTQPQSAPPFLTSVHFLIKCTRQTARLRFNKPK